MKLIHLKDLQPLLTGFFHITAGVHPCGKPFPECIGQQQDLLQPLIFKKVTGGAREVKENGLFRR
jgi:hypothetical protein